MGADVNNPWFPLITISENSKKPLTVEGVCYTPGSSKVRVTKGSLKGQEGKLISVHKHADCLLDIDQQPVFLPLSHFEVIP